MKKIVAILGMCLIVSMVEAQNPYSNENLQKLSQEELDVYYNKALKLKKTGGTLTLVGIGSFAGGLTLAKVGWDHWSEEAVTFWALIALAGIPTTLICLPIYITGSDRVAKINAIKILRLRILFLIYSPQHSTI